MIIFLASIKNPEYIEHCGLSSHPALLQWGACSPAHHDLHQTHFLSLFYMIRAYGFCSTAVKASPI